MALFGGRRITRTGILFIIGIIVLAGLVTGAVFLVKNRGEAVRRDEAIKVAEQNLKDQSEVAKQSDKDDASEDKNDLPAGTIVDEVPATTNPDAVQLPQTGPNDLEAISRIAIVAILALSVSFYVSSRRSATRQ